MKRLLKFLALLALPAAFAGTANAATTPCGGMATLNLPHAQVTNATLVSAGAFTPPNPPQGPNAVRTLQAYAALPAFCRVQATSRPTPDSEIKIEVWLPVTDWNGRLQAVGNGGFSPAIQYQAMGQALAAGYAAAATNTGQETNNGDFSAGKPEKMVDWGNRAVHETAVIAKAVIAAHYGKGPNYAYWNSCSTGGRQGLVAAEYYPNDFDGLAIGDPANPMTRLQANNIAINLALTKSETSFITPEKWGFIHDAVMTQCDEKDGLKDKLIQDPRACNFDVQTLRCRDGDRPDCLNAAQFEALNLILTGSKNPRTGASIYPGYPIGVAMTPGPVTGRNPDSSGPATFRMLFQKPDWDWKAMDLDKDLAAAEAIGDKTINAVDETRLKPLFDRGGKILMYHGWSDPAISALISIDYYEKAVAANGGLGRTFDSIRLFMVPGMAHCMGGEGPNSFDKMAPLVEWVEKGRAPNQIVATHLTADVADRTRPLCPYPQVAKYKGAGSIDEAASFACARP